MASAGPQLVPSLPSRFKTVNRHTPARLAVAAALLLAGACTDSPVAPISPPEPGPAGVTALECSVQVQDGTFSCESPAPATGGASANKIMGGQERYVRLAGSGAAFDAGTQLFTLNVTVQNMLRQAIGTPDGVAVEGVMVFFDGNVVVTGGTGSVEVANEDGEAFFMAADQPYFLYNQILQPYEISAPRSWLFQLTSGVTSFRFQVYISAPMPDESGSMLDAVWNGSDGSAWTDARNWTGGIVPDAASTVQIPADSLFTGAQPVLSADAELTHLRVGLGSSLDLGTYTLTASGNVDATGALQNGTVVLEGTGAMLNGSLPSVRVTGSVELQGSTVASGAVSIQDGALNLAGRPLSIQVP